MLSETSPPTLGSSSKTTDKSKGLGWKDKYLGNFYLETQKPKGIRERTWKEEVKLCELDVYLKLRF